ncbi:MAG: peptidoglycan DD-metalloendopeptidase family protein [Acidobacteriia bacterium]|nr:peptidoglycan DD-metalloendopeptidase family protein [Terriglobia bacterium]
MHRPTLLFLFSATLVAQQPLFRVVDLDVGARERVEFSDGKSATVKLLSTSETRDRVRSAIRDARVEVEINGARATLSCGNYRLPVAVGGVQADCAVTKAYYQDSNADHWALVKDARLRLWPAGSPYMPPGSFVYPVRQRWFATRTQMGNEPTYVDDGESIGSRRIYYHAGLDIGGAEGLVDVVAATDGLVVGVGTEILDKEKNNASLDRQYNDTIWVLDERGWYQRYTHLFSFDPSVKLGGRVQMGQKIGTLGKEGGSGGWSHLHYEILSRQASGRLGTLEGYAFLWEAYQRQYKPHLIAVARPHQAVLVEEKVLLDGSRSYSDSRIERFAWTFTDGGKASGPRVERTYSQPGTYSEILKITDDRGGTDYDFETVNVLDPQHPEQTPPSIQAAYWPTTGIVPGASVTFKARTFGTRDGQETWSFGDGGTASTKSDGNAVPRAKDGFAITTHVFQRPGDYIVRVERANRLGQKAIAHLFVRVGGSE